MSKIELFFNHWEANFGPATFKKDGPIGLIIGSTPILSAIVGLPLLITHIKHGPLPGMKIEFAVDIITGVMTLLGLGLLVFLIAALITLGKKLKQACSSCGSKDQQRIS